MQDLTVIKYELNDSGNGYRMTINISDPLQMNTSGITLLVQKTVMWLLKTPGRDYFNKEDGGGLLQLKRPQMWSEARDTITTNVKEAIAAVESQMKAHQLGIDRPDDEKLDSLWLMGENGIIYVEDVRGFMINIGLKSVAGEKAEFALPIKTKES